MAPPKTAGEPRGSIHGSIGSGLVTYTLRAIPLPSEITTFLVANASTLKKLVRDRRGRVEEDVIDDVKGEALVGVEAVKAEDFWTELEKVCKAAGKDWAGLADQIWSFGPRRVGANILVDRTPGSERSFVLAFVDSLRSAPLTFLTPLADFASGSPSRPHSHPQRPRPVLSRLLDPPPLRPTATRHQTPST